MNSVQISSILNNLDATRNLFNGCYKNDTIPFHLKSKRNGFFIVNTNVNVTTMGHWILFYIKYSVLYFFDSFGENIKTYGLDIESFFSSFNGDKVIAIRSPLQDDLSYVCGAYVIYFAYMMGKNHSIYSIKSKFSKNRKRNDIYVTKFILIKTRTYITCNRRYCSSYMFQTKCRQYCTC